MVIVALYDRDASYWLNMIVLSTELLVNIREMNGIF
jgi:hypothetical protein